MAETVPTGWMPVCTMTGIVVHWTAGAHKATEFDRAHYHILINADGTLVRGIPTIKMNAAPLSATYAAHTRGHNTGIIGVSLCCMGDYQNPSRVKESPFVPGPYPMTRAQWDKLPFVLADLCRFYKIPIGPKTVLSHAEVEPTLGIKQLGKWDVSRLAFDETVKGAKACGDIFRARTAAILSGKVSLAPVDPPPIRIEPAVTPSAPPHPPVRPPATIVEPKPQGGFWASFFRAFGAKA